jgi:hypothetical protein
LFDKSNRSPDRQILPPREGRWVTRVTATRTGAAAANRPQPGAAASSGFSVAAETAPAPAQEAQAPQSVVLSGILALQEAAAGTVQDRAARRHGLALLDILARLQKSLLSGSQDPAHDLRTLTELIAEMPQAADPGLAGVLDAVRLRAKIELLRRGVPIS